MQAPNVNTPIAERISTIFVAIELSQKELVGNDAQPGPGSDLAAQAGGGDHANLLALVDRVPATTRYAQPSRARIARPMIQSLSSSERKSSSSVKCVTRWR